MTATPTLSQTMGSYKGQLLTANRLINIANEIWLEKDIELFFYGITLRDQRASLLLTLCQEHNVLSELDKFAEQTVCIAEGIRQIGTYSCQLDLGELMSKMANLRPASLDLFSFLNTELNTQRYNHFIVKRDVVLYGFGRIGRLLARELTCNIPERKLQLRAVVVREPATRESLEMRAELLRRDSIHGRFSGTIEIDEHEQSLLINGSKIIFISASSPESINYEDYNIHDALVIDNTGAFRDRTALGRHLSSRGATQVLLTAPGKGIPNIVYGVNQDMIAPVATDICSAASCTTNAIAPILHIVHKEAGILRGHVETIHSYTNDQNLVDNMHSKSRRGRAAALNMVITETGAGSAVAKVIPELAGKLTSNAIRVPIPNGSLAILQLELEQPWSSSERLQNLSRHITDMHMDAQIAVDSRGSLVSSDIVGSSNTSTLDERATILSEDQKHVVLYLWYDNEYGYTQQVLRVAQKMAGVFHQQ